VHGWDLKSSVVCRSRILVPLFFAMGARVPFGASLVKRTGKRRAKKLNKNVNWRHSCAHNGVQRKADEWSSTRDTGQLNTTTDLRWCRALCAFGDEDFIRSKGTLAAWSLSVRVGWSRRTPTLRRLNTSLVWCRLGLRTWSYGAGVSREAKPTKYVQVMNNYTQTEKNSKNANKMKWQQKWCRILLTLPRREL